MGPCQILCKALATVRNPIATAQTQICDEACAKSGGHRRHRCQTHIRKRSGDAATR